MQNKNPSLSNGDNQPSSAAPGVEPLAWQFDDIPAPTEPEGRTEGANAKRLCALHGQSIRYCYPWGKWLTWDGCRWSLDDAGQVETRAKAIPAWVWQAVQHAKENGGVSKKLLDFATSTDKASGIANMLRLAQSEPDIPLAPAAMDADPWAFNCQNGTIELTSGKLREHRREDYLTQLSPVSYYPEAQCPLWLRTLDKVFGGNQALIDFFQRAVGYTLTGLTREQILFFLYGTGANGKTTIMSVLQKLFGQEMAIEAPRGLLMVRLGEQHPTELASLFGKRLVACTETQKGKRLDESLVKSLTGGDQISARRMHEDFWTFEPTHKLWISGNYKPTIRGTDHGIWRRLLLIPFTIKIPDEDKDPELLSKLLAELPGILAWAVLGCLAWQKGGLAAPEEVLLATNEYRSDMDVLSKFVDECCVIGEGEEHQSRPFYSAYSAWAKGGNFNCLSETAFVNEMKVLLEEKGVTKDQGKGGRMFWFGIGLKPQQSDGNTGTEAHDLF